MQQFADALPQVQAAAVAAGQLQAEQRGMGVSVSGDRLTITSAMPKLTFTGKGTPKVAAAHNVPERAIAEAMGKAGSKKISEMTQ
jgi:hypothetical protein